MLSFPLPQNQFNDRAPLVLHKVLMSLPLLANISLTTLGYWQILASQDLALGYWQILAAQDLAPVSKLIFVAQDLALGYKQIFAAHNLALRYWQQRII